MIHDHSGPSTTIVRIEPAESEEMRPFWDAAAAGRFEVPRCQACGGWSFPPRGICRHCRSFEVVFTQTSPRGVLYSFTINRHEWVEGVGTFGLGLVDFPSAAGVRLLARMSIDFDLDAVAIGRPVELRFARAASGPPIPFLVPGES